MAYEASKDLEMLMKSKARGKHLFKRDFKDYLEIIAKDGHIPYDEVSLNIAIDTLFTDINDYKNGRESGMGYLVGDIFPTLAYMRAFEELIYRAGKNNGLRYKPEEVVKRIITRGCGETEKSREAEKNALELLEKVERKTKVRKPEVLGAAVLYAVMGDGGLTQREISEYSFCNEVSIRNAVKELKKIGPEFFDKSKLK